MQRRSVDLPLPDAPIRQTTSCSATSRSMPAQDLEVAERLVEALDPRAAGRHGARVSAPVIGRAARPAPLGRGRRASR